MKRLVAIQSFRRNVFLLKRMACCLPKTEKNAVLMARWNVGVIKKDNQVAGFVGATLKGQLKDGLLFGVQQIGNGSISYLADDVLFRSFWETGKLLFCNAVFLVGQ